MNVSKVSKVDLRKELAEFYPTVRKAMTPHIVVVPTGLFVVIDGVGDPNTSPAFQEGTGALYAVSYTAKFASKANGADYGVMPLEGLWWADDLESFQKKERKKWKWTLMIRHPEFVSELMLRDALETVVAKGKVSAEIAQRVRIERIDEGESVQVLHVGPYESEGPVITSMHEFARSNGYSLRGKHHEIYLGDPRKAAPDKLKTVLRHPVERS